MISMLVHSVQLTPDESEFLMWVWWELYQTGIQQRRATCTGMSSFSFLPRRITFDATADRYILAENWEVIR